MLLSDFVHSSGIVLEADVRHLECEVVLGKLPAGSLKPKSQGDQPVVGMTVMDPYNVDGAAVYRGIRTIATISTMLKARLDQALTAEPEYFKRVVAAM